MMLSSRSRTCSSASRSGFRAGSSAMASYEIVEGVRGKVLSTDFADFHREKDPKSVSIGEICGLIRTPLAAPATRAKQRGAARGFDVKRQLELLVPGSAPGEEGEKLPEIAHMFS
jgi:hypothetical protein